MLMLSLVSLSMIMPIKAEDDENIDLSDLPAQFSEKMGIDLFAAQLLTSGIVLCIFLFPTLLLTGCRNWVAPLFVGLTVLGFCVAMGWLPVFILLLLVLLSALMLGDRIKALFS